MTALRAFADWISANGWALLADATKAVMIFVAALLLRGLAGRVITQSLTRLQRTRARGDGVPGRRWRSQVEIDDRHAQRIQTISAVLRSTTSVILFGVAFVMMLAQFEINVTPILASAGVLGLAVGFGAQSLVKDIIAGVFMLAEDQYGVGDVVDVGSAVGTVEAISLRVVKIRDLDGGLWYVRNGEISSVCNMSQEWANSVVEVPLEPTVEMVKAKAAVQRALEQFATESSVTHLILETPTLAGVTSMTNGAITIRVVSKTKPGTQWAVGRALRETLKETFDAEGVQLAWPRTVLGSAS